MQRQRGFTLIELLVVLAIIGLALAGVSLSLRDNALSQLEREAQRLIAILEAARAQSRTQGVAYIWQATPEGFSIQSDRASALDAGMPSAQNAPNFTPNSNRSSTATRTYGWLAQSTQAQVSTPLAWPNRATSATPITPVTPANWVVLGPEPILAPTRITLYLATSERTPTAATLSIGTNGLQAFKVMP